MYWSTASATVWPVNRFFSSMVAMGRPFMNRAISRERCRWVVAVAELAGDREPVLQVSFLCLGVVRGRGPVEQGDVVLAMPDAEPQDVDDAPAGNFSLEAV